MPTREIERGTLYCLPMVMRPSRVKRRRILDIISPSAGRLALSYLTDAPLLNDLSILTVSNQLEFVFDNITIGRIHQ
jgi:hypothetical protein